MFIGHYAVALAAKRAAPEASLGQLTAAALALDLVWPALYLAGVETARIVPGATAVMPVEFTRYPYSHSLAAAALWAVAAGAACRGLRTAIVTALLVLSHWPLDAITHAPDLPLTLGDAGRVGLGLWRSWTATAAAELPLLAAGVWLYASRFGSPPALRAYVAALAALFALSLAGSAPPVPGAIPLAGALQAALVLWAWRADRPSRKV